jgi:hypothetical protein
MLQDDVEVGYVPIVSGSGGGGSENRTGLCLTMGACALLGIFIGAIYLIGYLFSKKIWL